MHRELSTCQVQAPLFHQTSLRKHNFKDKIIENFKTATTEPSELLLAREARPALFTYRLENLKGQGYYLQYK